MATKSLAFASLNCGPGSAAAVVADGDPERADAIGGRAAEVGRDRVRS